MLPKATHQDTAGVNQDQQPEREVGGVSPSGGGSL